MRASRSISALLAIAGCTAVSPPAPQLDLTEPPTWAWLVPEEGPWGADDPDLDAAVRAAVERELAARGCVAATALPPDLFVTYDVEIERRVRLASEQPPLETLYSLHDSPSYEIQHVETVTRFYEDATLTVSVANASDREVVWTGSARRRARRSFTPHAARTVEQAFRGWPTTTDDD